MRGEPRDGYNQIGESDFSDADDANIPVNIFLHKAKDEDDNELEGWTLTADNFMPRKGSCCEGTYEFFSKDRQTLVDMVQKHWRPFYEKALEKLKLEPDKDGEASLYYWS